jgi:hypothetical protein
LFTSGRWFNLTADLGSSISHSDESRNPADLDGK